jgi:PPOX class probable F420-dependent enzyme
MPDHAAALEFIRNNPRAVLATFRKDGSIQMSPVVAAVDDEARVVISSTTSTAKVRNLERDPRGTLCVMSERFFGEWHGVEGPVEILRLPEAMEPLVDYYRRVSGEHPDWAEYREAMVGEGRVLLRLTPERSVPASS